MLHLIIELITNLNNIKLISPAFFFYLIRHKWNKCIIIWLGRHTFGKHYHTDAPLVLLLLVGKRWFIFLFISGFSFEETTLITAHAKDMVSLAVSRSYVHSTPSMDACRQLRSLKDPLVVFCLVDPPCPLSLLVPVRSLSRTIFTGSSSNILTTCAAQTEQS